MKRTSVLVVLALLGCAEPEVPAGTAELTFAERFLAERAFRRESLERAVENPNNDYSALRLAEYATATNDVATGWDALEPWNPGVRPLTLDEPQGAHAGAALWDGQTPQSREQWLALGRRAFELWPSEIDDRAGALAQSALSRAEFGMWQDDRGRVAGLVRVLTADGIEHVAWSCSGCHARTDADGHLVHGLAAVSLDRGAMNPALLDGSAPSAWAWGRGRLDVTADGLENPTAIPDLRATSHQTHLHCEATLVNSLPALSVRIETLIIENLHGRLRPPREVAVALALYVTSLGAAAAPPPLPNRSEGARLFEQHCATCHHADGSSAPPVAPEIVGTDRRAADSPTRSTGRYRIPSLWAVSDRGQLLHDGSIANLAMLLDPERLGGHRFGLDLEPSERTALIAFLGTIGR